MANDESRQQASAPAAKLDSLLPLLSRAMRARHEDERLKRRRCDDANEWEEEFVVCEFEGGAGLAPVGAAFMVEAHERDAARLGPTTPPGDGRPRWPQGLDSTSPRVRVNGLEFTGKLEEEARTARPASTRRRLPCETQPQPPGHRSARRWCLTRSGCARSVGRRRLQETTPRGRGEWEIPSSASAPSA